MSTLDNALQGIKHIKDPEVIAGMKVIQDNFYAANNIIPGTHLDKDAYKHLCGLWTDFIIKAGGILNGAVRN